MAKKNKSSKSSRKNLLENAEWAEERLNSMMLDIEALASMSIDEVKEELQNIAPEAPDLARTINERLPAGIELPKSATNVRRRRNRPSSKKADRPSNGNTTIHRRNALARWFSLRNAFILSILVILGALLIPPGIRSLRNAPPDPATAVYNESPAVETPPTWLEGPAQNELIRGVRYTISGLDRVAVRTPLPSNPGSIQTFISFEITIDASGEVSKLVSLATTPHNIEPAVIDSLLQWQFNPVEGDTSARTGSVTIEFEPW